jgi:tRNA modification GTPase
MDSTDTIVASATASGQGAVSVIRLSGPSAVHIGEQLARRSFQPRYATYGALHSASHQIDTGLWLYFPTPHSFTGEDVVEFQGHGGPVVIQQCIQAMVALGARPAKPGEFSERAFLNDKIDLTQAEAIADLIAASSDQAVHAANQSLNGAFGDQINGLVHSLIRVRTQIEAHIDFPDEEISPAALHNIESDLNAIHAPLTYLLQNAEDGLKLNQSPQIGLIGAPNAGKSSLLNALAQQPLAIVTDIPGTTRDLIRHTIVVRGLELSITDTAGIRDTDDEIEQEGIKRARAALSQCDIIVCLFDATTHPQIHQDDLQALLSNTLAPTQTLLVIHNKIDLDPGPLKNLTLFSYLRLSAVRGDGLDDLLNWFDQHLRHQDRTETVFTARTRHLKHLRQALHHLSTAQSIEMTPATLDLVAEDLRLAQQSLSEITGGFTSDDLLGEIFSNFCIGK